MAEASLLLADPEAYRSMARGVSPYGDGRATARIVAILRRYFGSGRHVETEKRNNGASDGSLA